MMSQLMLDLLKKLKDERLDYRERIDARNQILDSARSLRRELVEAFEKERSEAFRIELLRIFGSTRDDFFADTIQGVIETEKSEKVLQTAANSLGTLKVGFPVLVNLLDHKSANVRLGAVWGLAALGNKAAVEHLLSRLDDHGPINIWWASPKADGYSVAEEAAVAIDSLTGQQLNGDKTKIREWIAGNVH